MKQLAMRMKQFLISEDGLTAVEYAVLIAMIAIVCITAIQAAGINADAEFGQAGDSVL